MRWCIHHSREFATIILAGMTAFLHAFNDKHIFDKNITPHGCIGGTHIGKGRFCCRVLRIIDFDMFDGAIWPVRCQNNAIAMVTVNAKKQIWE